MRHYRGLGRQRKKSVEAGDAISFGRRDIEPLANIVERLRTDPAKAILHCVQRRQQEVPAGAQVVATAGSVTAMFRESHAAYPTRIGRSEHGVYRRSLSRIWWGGTQS